jgi:hypothetical protein
MRAVHPDVSGSVTDKASEGDYFIWRAELVEFKHGSARFEDWNV